MTDWRCLRSKSPTWSKINVVSNGFFRPLPAVCLSLTGNEPTSGLYLLNRPCRERGRPFLSGARVAKNPASAMAPG
jgi:hypothetical protein